MASEKPSSKLPQPWFKPRIEKHEQPLGWCIKLWTPHGPRYATSRDGDFDGALYCFHLLRVNGEL